MGCSSSKSPRRETAENRPDVFIPSGGAPKANCNEVLNGSHIPSDDLDDTANKKKLLLKKHQTSIEGRHNQVLLQLLSFPL